MPKPLPVHLTVDPDDTVTLIHRQAEKLTTTDFKSIDRNRSQQIGSTSTAVDRDAMKLTVQVISDVICPWCFIGKRRLEKGIAAQSESVTVRWFPFQLNPTMPKEGISRREYRTKKFGSWERSQELDAKVIATGKEEGIDFDFEQIERTPNTFDAHRLIWLAEKEKVQDAVVEGLFQAYFKDGSDIGNQQTLIDVATESGLDQKRAESMLDGDEGVEEIKDALELSRRHQVDSVPFFIVNRQITLSGAQPPDTFLEAFRLASGEK